MFGGGEVPADDKMDIDQIEPALMPSVSLDEMTLIKEQKGNTVSPVENVLFNQGNESSRSDGQCALANFLSVVN